MLHRVAVVVAAAGVRSGAGDGAAYRPPPRSASRYDPIRLKAEDLKLGLPCDSVYLKRRDSLRRNDSLRRQAEQRNQRLYDSIRSKTTRRAVPRLLYRMLFVNPVLDTTANGRVLDESRQFERYSGRRIGEVVIAQDPVFTPDGNWLERTGNKLHVMTRERVLRRDLLFEPGDTIAPELLVRNLQLLRSRAYISDATMELTPDSLLDSTRVVVTLRSRDSWTISADAALHGEGRTMIGLSDANIFGSGNRLSVATNFSRNDFGYGGNVVSYDIPNFLGSFYKANFSAGRDFYNSELRIGVGKGVHPADRLRTGHRLQQRQGEVLSGRPRHLRPGQVEALRRLGWAFALHSFDPFERLPHGALRFRALLAPSRRDEDLQPGFFTIPTTCWSGWGFTARSSTPPI